MAEQLSAGATPLPVPFAADLKELLRGRGFSAEEIVRYLAIFFQIRRAAYFIG